MVIEFIHTLRRLKGTIIGWSIGLFLYDLFISYFFSSVKEMGDIFDQIMQSYPAQMLAFFPGIKNFGSPTGYIDTYFSGYMTFILGFFSASVCAHLLVGDEEKGVLDLVLSYPLRRSSLFWGRFLGFIAALELVFTATWLGWLIPAKGSGLELNAAELLLPLIPLFCLQIFVGGFALLFSLLLPSVRWAGSLTSALLVGNFFLYGMSNINSDLKPLYELTPFYFTQGSDAINNLKIEWLLGLLLSGLLLAGLAWLRFLRRDIRVSGEGGWQINWFNKGSKP